MNDPAKPIRDLLGNDCVCVAIVSYLIRNKLAADTAQGIADWWIDHEVGATRAALDRLTAHGVVRPHRVQGAPVYTLTKNPRVRAAVRHCLGELEPSARERPVNHDA